jgi:hypothetical protein
MVGIGPVGRVVDLAQCPAGGADVVDDARRGGDQVEIIFAGQPLLDDLEVEEARKPQLDKRKRSPCCLPRSLIAL